MSDATKVDVTLSQWEKDDARRLDIAERDVAAREEMVRLASVDLERWTAQRAEDVAMREEYDQRNRENIAATRQLAKAIAALAESIAARPE